MALGWHLWERARLGLGVLCAREIRRFLKVWTQTLVAPAVTTLLMLAILLTGMISYFNLPLSALPSVDYPTIQVQTFYPGASPEVMTSAVTAPPPRCSSARW